MKKWIVSSEEIPLIPLARTEEVLTDLYGQSPPESVIMAANRRLASATQGSLDQVMALHRV